MIKTLGTITALSCLLAASSAFAGDRDNFYVDLSGKYSRMGDVGITNLTQVDTDEGYGFAAAVGKQMEWLRFEAEIATQENDLNNIEVGGRGLGAFDNGDVSIDSLMANAYADIPLASGFSVYCGGGLGAANVTVGAYDYEFDETVFAYKLGAGVSYDFNSAWGIRLGYEYFATDDVEYDRVTASDIESNSLSLGVKFMF